MRLHLPFAVIVGALTLPSCLPTGDDSDGKDSGVPLTVVPVTEDVSTPTTWTNTNLYRLDEAIAVTDALTIQPGTIVKLGPGLSISVSGGGSIVAQQGDPRHMCVFTSVADDAHGGDTNEDGNATAPAPGDWGYVTVSASGSVFDHCSFLYGGGNAPYTGTLTVTDDARITVTNSTFAYNAGGTLADTRAGALNAGSSGPGTVLTGDLFYGNELPLVIGANNDLDDTTRFEATVDGALVTNTFNAIAWGGSYELVGDRSWLNTDVPYVITGSVLGVPEGGSLTLGDGVIVKFPAEQRMGAPGTLLATGTIFTSVLDDENGGDTNGDGSATSPGPGDWGYLALSSDTSVIDGCSILYAGSAAPYTGAMSVDEGANPQIRDSVFAHNAGGTFEDNRAAALNLGSAGASVTVTGNTFYENDYPMVINGDVSLDDSNTFSDPDSGARNGVDAIGLDGSSHAVNGSTSWGETDAAFVLYHTTLSIDEAGALTLGAGVVVKSDASRIDVAGALEAGEDTWFTSLYDDAHVGDTNGDGTGTSPADGDWLGVNLCLGGPCEWAAWSNILYATYP